MTKKQNISIFYTNVCSIGNKWHELTLLAEEFDIVSITETWLNPDLAIERFCPSGYTLYRSDRQDGRVGGGSLILVASHYNQSKGPSLITPNIQLASCSLSFQSTHILIATIYRSPQAETLEDDKLLAVLEPMSTGSDKLVVLGDFNAPDVDWSTEAAPSNSFGDKLLRWVNTSSLIQHIDQPTRCRLSQKSNILDLVITKFLNDVNSIMYHSPIGKSDHCVLKLNLSLNSTEALDKFRRAFYKIDLHNLLNDASGLKWECDETMDINLVWMSLKSNILELTNKHAPLKKLKRGGKPPWWTARVTKALKQKNNAWLAYRSSNGHNKFLQYNLATKKTSHVLLEARSTYEQRLAKKAKINSKAFYNYVQSKGSLCAYVGNLQDATGNSVSSNEGKAMLLLKFFESVHIPDSGKPTPTVAPVEVSPMEDFEFSVCEVKVALEHLNPSKSAGPDEIHPAMLRALADILALPLCILFNRSLRETSLPADWKTAVVIPIHKGGSKEMTGNFRPVSLTSVILKTLERLIRDKIALFLSQHGLLSAQQHGFMKNRSCLTNLLCFLDEITLRLDNGHQVEVCYLDFKKAFDLVNHRLLLVKLRQYHLSTTIVN